MTNYFAKDRSHPTWVRGLKHLGVNVLTTGCSSHPTWVRGLKLSSFGCEWLWYVAPYVGAWIETGGMRYRRRYGKVAPYVGAWIETFLTAPNATKTWSHPTWVRGLKLGSYAGKGVGSGRTLRGCVD